MLNKEDAVIISDLSDVFSYIDLFTKVQLSIGMRYHFLACCALAGTPSVGIAYNPKISSLSKSLGSNVISTTIELEHLKKIVDKAILNLDILQIDLEKKVNIMHSKCRQYDKLLYALVGQN